MIGRSILVASTLAALAGCGGSPITAVRIQAALETIFANLAELQVSRLNLPPMPAPEFAVTAICRNLATGRDAGAGEWTCSLLWQGPNREPLRDTYELFVATDGCYTATVSGESLGGPTVRAPDGTFVKNLLYKFEGCFNTL